MTVVEKRMKRKTKEKETSRMLYTLFTNRNTFYAQVPGTSLLCKLYILLKYGAV